MSKEKICSYLKKGTRVSECHSPYNGDPRTWEPSTCFEKNPSECIFRSEEAYSAYLHSRIKKLMLRTDRQTIPRELGEYDNSLMRRTRRGLRLSGLLS